MFRKALFLFLTLTVFLGSIKIVNQSSAQEIDFEKSYNDYVFTQSQYFESYGTFSEARDNYLKNKTLSLKEESRKATFDMLQKRDELYRVYLAMLRIKLLSSKGLTTLELSSIEARVNDEMKWYVDHMATYKNSDPLEDLINKSKESESRYKTHSQKVIYQALFFISVGETAYLRQENEKMYQVLKTIINDKVSQGRLRIDPFNRWFNDIEGSITVIKEKEEKGKQEILKMDSETYLSGENAYEKATEVLQEGNTELARLSNFVKELLTSISNQL